MLKDIILKPATTGTTSVKFSSINGITEIPFIRQDVSFVKVVVRACYGANFVAHIFKYLAPNFASGRTA